jgi:2-octaprenylphenol hydroxylase
MPHTVHPLAGQGVNLGFGDVQCLAALLAPAADIGAWHLLTQYRQQRLLPVRTMQQGCDGLFKLFADKHMPGLPWLRNTGLNLVNHTPLLKTQLMRHAMGL